jgi:hypothetical protein
MDNIGGHRKAHGDNNAKTRSETSAVDEALTEESRYRLRIEGDTPTPKEGK